MATLLPSAEMWMQIATCQLIQVICRLSHFPGCTFYFAGFSSHSIADCIAQVTSLNTELSSWELLLYQTCLSHYVMLPLF